MEHVRLSPRPRSPFNAIDLSIVRALARPERITAASPAAPPPEPPLADLFDIRRYDRAIAARRDAMTDRLMRYR